jgi:nicotinamidase-related amidase
VPVIASEQYPKGLGPTVEPIAERLRAMGVEPIAKTTFDACAEPRLAQALSERSPRAVVVSGMETHICVFQTARELVRRGLEVHVAADAVASRREENRGLGLALCERAGAYLTPTETVIFDWLGRAGTDAFKAVSKLVR